MTWLRSHCTRLLREQTHHVSFCLFFELEGLQSFQCTFFHCPLGPAKRRITSRPEPRHNWHYRMYLSKPSGGSRFSSPHLWWTAISLTRNATSLSHVTVAVVATLSMLWRRHCPMRYTNLKSSAGGRANLLLLVVPSRQTLGIKVGTPVSSE